MAMIINQIYGRRCHMKRVFAILAAVAAGLGMVAAIIAAVVNRRENY